VKRVFALAVVLVALGVAVAALAGEVGVAGRGVVRWLALLGLPLLAGAAAVAIVPRPGLPASAPGRRLALLAGALVGLDLAPIGVGFLLHQVTFTYGDQTLAAGRILVMLFGLPAVIAVTIVGWERALRERVYGGAVQAGAPAWGALLSMLAGLALSLVAFAPGFEAVDRGFAVAAGATALLREATAVRLFGAGGRLVSGLYRGTLAGIEGLVIADWASFWFPSANFVSSDERFAWLRVAGPALALLVAFVMSPQRVAAPVQETS
jgi:hypothetical protein